MKMQRQGNTAAYHLRTAHLSIDSADDTHAHQAGLHARKLLVQVGLPHTDGIQYALVLVAQEHGNGQQPLAQPAILDANLKRGKRRTKRSCNMSIAGTPGFFAPAAITFQVPPAGLVFKKRWAVLHVQT